MSGVAGFRALLLALFAVGTPVDAVRAAGPACVVESFVELPVSMAGRRPIVKAKVNGIEQPFLADTGALLSMVSPAVAARLKMTIGPAPKGLSMGGVGGSFDVRMAIAKSFEIAGRTMAGVNFLVGGGDQDVTAIIGQNFLGMADAQYDLAGGMIRLVKASSCGEQAAAAWAAGEPYAAMDIEPMTRGQRHIAGYGSINGITIRVVFDTGAPTTLLSLEAARRAGLNPGQPGMVSIGATQGLGGAVSESWLAPSASYRIGGRDVRGDPIRVTDLGAVPFDLLIGADFFLSHRLYVAASRNRLYFADLPGKPGAGSLPALVDAEAYGRRAGELAAKRDLANALADLNRAVEMAPNEPGYLIQRARLRLEAKQDLLARHDLDRAVALRPEMIEARLARAMVLLADKNFDQAKADLAVAASVSPPDAEHRFFLGTVHAGLEDWRAARQQFDLWLHAHPADPRVPIARNASCWAGAMLNEELSRALADCDAALAQAPQRIEIRDSRATVLLRLGRWDEAISDFDAMLAKQPDFAWSLHGRGLAKLRKGREAEGRADLAAALEQDPGIAEKARLLGFGS